MADFEIGAPCCPRDKRRLSGTRNADDGNQGLGARQVFSGLLGPTVLLEFGPLGLRKTRIEARKDCALNTTAKIAAGLLASLEGGCERAL